MRFPALGPSLVSWHSSAVPLGRLSKIAIESICAQTGSRRGGVGGRVARSSTVAALLSTEHQLLANIVVVVSDVTPEHEIEAVAAGRGAAARLCILINAKVCGRCARARRERERESEREGGP